MLISVRDESEVGGARRATAEFGRHAGLSESNLGRLALIATEMATNLVKHGGGGDLVCDHFADADGTGIELLALDKGRGMEDMQRCIGDGYSTAGSTGTGLGAISRQSDRFALFSRPGLGTAVMARLIVRSCERRLHLGAVVATYPGETVCGDGWGTEEGPFGPTLLVVDGSGHGPHAAHAAKTALRVFAENQDQDCVPLMEAIHRALAPTRGAAVAVARIDAGAQTVRFVGIGNIAAAVIDGGEIRRMISSNGTAGHVAPRIQEYAYPYQKNALIILHSDGISARWDLATYPGLAASYPSLLAGVIFRDLRRGRDDATVVAMRSAA